MRIKCVMVAAMLCACMLAPAAFAQTSGAYSAAGEFSLSANPSRSWSYGFTSSLGGSFQLLTLQSGCCWVEPNNFLPLIAGQGARLLLHPGGSGEYSVLRWTSPRNGTVRVAGHLNGLDTATTDVHVLHNSVSIFDSSINGLGDLTAFDLNLTVKTGDTIDFAVGDGGNGSNFDSTGVLAAITSYRFATIDVSGAVSTLARAINDEGDIVGDYTDSSGTIHGFRLIGSSYTTLDYPGATATFALGIESGGRIVGAYLDSGGAQHGFLWQNGSFSTVDFPAAVNTIANDINSVGQIVGAYDDSGGATHGFLLSGGTWRTIDFPGAASFTQAQGINTRREIVGFYFDSNGDRHGFLLRGETFANLDLPFGSQTAAFRTDNRGGIAGTFVGFGGTAHGFVITGGESFALDFPGGRNNRARGINTGGQIVGDYIDFSGVRHGYLATPLLM